MILKLELGEITASLRIYEYDPHSSQGWEFGWTKADYSILGPGLSVSGQGEEQFHSTELESLSATLTKLLNGELLRDSEWEGVDSLFRFILHPQKDKRDDPYTIWVDPGCALTDISLDWQVLFYQNSGNYLSLSLARREIQHLRDYLDLVMGCLDQTDPLIASMASSGVLLK